MSSVSAEAIYKKCFLECFLLIGRRQKTIPESSPPPLLHHISKGARDGSSSSADKATLHILVPRGQGWGGLMQNIGQPS
jgi:hypothetical protein